MKHKILLTSVGGELSPNVILSAKNDKYLDITVIGTDLNPKALGKYFCDYFYKVPRPNKKKYIKKIAQICRTHKIDLVLPTSDEEALILSKYRNLIEVNNTKLACTDFKTIKIFNNKIYTYQKLNKLGFNKTDYIIIKNKFELSKKLKKILELYNEIICKPANSRGGRNVFLISKKIKGYKFFNEAREILTDVESFNLKFKKNLSSSYPLILMKKLKEPVYDIDMLAWKGNAIAVVPRKRFNSSVPNDGHTIVYDKKLIDMGKKIISEFNLSWLYDCDVMFDRNGNPHLLEINPRPSGSFAVSIAAGIPYIRYLIYLSKGIKIPKIKVNFNQRIVPYKNLYKVK